MDRILYLTDRQGISSGYQSVMNQYLIACGLSPANLIITSIYHLVSNPIKKRGNEKEWVLRPEKLGEVQEALRVKVNAIRPKVIVTSDPAILGAVTNANPGVAKIGKARGSVFRWDGIPVVIVYPISASNRNFDAKDSCGLEGASSYKVKSGAWILLQDWNKVARYFKDSIRELPDFDYSIVRTREDIQHAERYLNSCVLVSSDIETAGTFTHGQLRTEITCVGYSGLTSTGHIKSYVYPIYDKFKPGGCYWSVEEHQLVVESIQRVNNHPNLKTLQNGSYDCAYFIRDLMPLEGYLLDSIHMWHSIYPELRKSLDFISSILLDNYQYWKADLKGLEDKDPTLRDTDMERYWRYNALDCYYTLCNTMYLWSILESIPTYKFNYMKEFMTQLAGIKMSQKGIRADKPRLASHRRVLEKQVVIAQERIKYLVDNPDFNVASAPQCASLIYDMLGARERNAKGKLLGASAGGKGRSVGEDAMKFVKLEHPMFKLFVDAIQDAKKPDKQISNICNMKIITNRFRYKLSASGTETWRYSGKSGDFWEGTNPQNIKETMYLKDGTTIGMRDWLVPDEGHIMWDVDYSQSDGAFIAYESNDPRMIELVKGGKDAHAVHAGHYFGSEYGWVVAGKKANDPIIVHPLTGIRQITKKIVHGANFQMYGGTLFVLMGWEMTTEAAILFGHPDAGTWTEEMLIQFCQRLLNMYRKLYPRLTMKEWYGEIKVLLRETRQITSAFGYTRQFMGDPDEGGTQREATSFYGQGGTSGNMNRTQDEIEFGYIPPTFRDGPNPHAKEQPLGFTASEFLLQVHDSFVGQSDMRKPGWKEDLINLLTVMERPIIINGHRMHVRAELALGFRWGKKMTPFNRNDPHALDRIVTTSGVSLN